MPLLRFLFAVLLTFSVIIGAAVLPIMFWISFVTNPYQYNPHTSTVLFYIFGTVAIWFVGIVFLNATIERIKQSNKRIKELRTKVRNDLE
jgi:uncharacterized membrane protein YbhN (UPF0104 family)